MESKNNKKVQDFIGIPLLIALVSLIYFVVSEQTNIYQNMEESNQLMSSAADKQSTLTRNYVSLYHQTIDTLVSVSKELDSTKVLLQQTQDFLAQAKSDNDDLRDELAVIRNQVLSNGAAVENLSFDKNKTDLEKQIALLNEKNSQFSNELAQIKEQMRTFEGDIKNLDEGKALISLFHNRLKMVRTKMFYLKREALFVRAAAQKERDHILLLKGNRGYLVKDGTAIKTNNPSVFSPDDKKVNIDVSFVE